VSTVVVTGTSGSVGQRVVDLLAGDAAVTRLVAIDLLAGRPDAAGVEYRTLDLGDTGDAGDGLDSAVQGAEVVIHLAWSHRSAPTGAGPGAPVGRPNLVATRRVLEAADRAGTSQVVFLSSGTVYGAWPDNAVPLPEDAAIRPNPGFAFAEEKAEAERLVAEWSDAHPQAAVAVLRPAVTVGAAGPALYRALARTAAPRSFDSGRPMQFLHVDDLVSAVAVVWRQRLSGVFNVAPDGWIADDTARTLTGGVPHVTLPGRMAGEVSAWGWRLVRYGTPREALAYVVHPWVLANDRLHAAGWHPAHTNEEALVSADDRARWPDLPLSRRQGLVLAGALAGVTAAGGGALGLASAVAARRRRAGGR
jgi:nucleoside-diphosphate-sugar epimerase